MLQNLPAPRPAGPAPRAVDAVPASVLVVPAAEPAPPARLAGPVGSPPAGSRRRAGVLVVGGGFAGSQALRRLERQRRPQDAELMLVSPTDSSLSGPLLPEVATRVLDPRHVAVSLRQQLPRTRLMGRPTSADRR